MKSFRTRLLLAIFGCAAAAVLAGGVFTYGMVKRHLIEEFDHFLGDKLRFHRVSCVQHGKRMSFKSNGDWRLIHDPDDPEYFQFRFLDGRDIYHSYSMPDSAPRLPILGMTRGAPEAQDCILPNGEPGRALGVRFFPAERDAGDTPVEINLVVAHQRGHLMEALARLRRLILFAGSVAALVLLGATILIVRQLLRPLEALTEQIGTAPVGEETGEFTLENAPLELQPVVERLNALMARVGSVLESERQFTSDAAHELRNPLAGLLSQVEVALERARDAAQDEETFLNVLEVQRQMEGTVQNLLVLARLDSGTERIATSPLDVGALARQAWKPSYEKAYQRELKIGWQVEAEMPPFETSRRLLEILLANLFDNATTYTPDGGEITISASRPGSQLHLAVANTNPGIAPTAAAGLFQRFRRGDRTSEDKRQHAGIGLSLCRKIVATLGGTITANATPDRFEIEVVLPATNTPKKDLEKI